MIISKTVSFEEVTEDELQPAVREIEILQLAANPIRRLAEYPDLMDQLKAAHVEDIEAAIRRMNTMTNSGNPVTNKIITEGLRILELLQQALLRDINGDYEPTDPKLVAVLREARIEQACRCTPAIDLLRKAWRATR